MQPDNFGYQQPSVARAGANIDAGLKAHMLRVYNRMTFGVFLTAVTAFVVSQSPALMQFFLGGPQMWIVALAPLAIVMFGFNPARMSNTALTASFSLLAVLYGISFSVLLVAFTGESVFQAFFMSTALFAGLSIFGYTTKKDLGPMRTFLFMAMWGLIIISLGTMAASFFGVNITMMGTIINAASLLIFSGLTAYETQQTKEMYHASHGDDANSRMAWAAALNLYISFVAMFRSILMLTGNRE